MKNNGFPVVRITLDYMKQTLLHAIDENMIRRDADVRQAVSDAIDLFDFNREIEAAVATHMKEAVHSAVQDAVRNARVQIASIATRVAGEVIERHFKEQA